VASVSGLFLPVLAEIDNSSPSFVSVMLCQRRRLLLQTTTSWGKRTAPMPINCQMSDRVDFHGFAHERLLKIIDFAEFYRKTA
jgi:hypothetical protein